MPGHTDKGTKNYRNMMKNMEKNMMRPDDIEPTTRDMLSSETIKPFEDDILDPPMPMSKFDEMLRKQMMEKTAMGRMGMAGMNAVEDAISGLSMADKEALDALTSMGISLEDAIEAIMGTVPQGMVEGAMGATMGGGALGALPMSRATTRPDEFGADRTQSMDMQKTGMGT